MKMPNVMRAIDHYDNLALDNTWINGERVLLELGRIAFIDLSNAIATDPETGHRHIDFDLLNEDQIRALGSVEFEKDWASVPNPNYDVEEAAWAKQAGVYYDEKPYLTKPKTKVKFKLYDKMKALELLARHFGLLNVSDDKDDMASLIVRALSRVEENTIDITPEEKKDE